MASGVEEKVKQIIVEQLQVDEAEVTPTASFQEDLGADSLDVMEVFMRLEDELGVAISDDEQGKIRTVGDVIEWLARALRGKLSHGRGGTP